MSCSQFQLWIVSDSAEGRRLAAEHAAECDRCAGILSGHLELQEQVASWREASEVPAHLEDRIRGALAGMTLRPLADRRSSEAGAAPRRGRAALWIGLAASFLIGIGLGWLQFSWGPQAPEQTRRLLAASDVEMAREVEHTQERTIAQLEQEVAPILARARNADLAAHEAAVLLEYRNRIASLNVAIDDVRGFVDENPGHPRARTMLQDAYREKTQLLREVLALEERSS